MADGDQSNRVALTERATSSSYARVRRLFVREFSITEGVILLMSSILLSALLGSVRQILLNARFGTGIEANAYYAAFRLPDGLFALIAGGALSSAMIPILLSTEREDGPAEWGRLVNLVLTSLMATLVVVVVCGEIFAPAFVHHLLAPGFDAETSQLTITLTRIMLVQPLILAGRQRGRGGTQQSQSILAHLDLVRQSQYLPDRGDLGHLAVPTTGDLLA